MGTAPRFSVVMPSFNQVRCLEEAVTSVLGQGGDFDVELLVMDPGSTDGSRELLSRLADRFGERLVPCFEPDRGQSDAINRGMERARGAVLGWLNSDDRLRPGVFAAVDAALASDAELRWTYGWAGMIDAAGRPCSRWIVRYKSWRGRRFSRLRLLTENFLPQMAVFFSRALWDRVGGLDPELDLDMDYDLWLRFARVAEPVVLRRTLADFRVHGAAKGSRRAGEQLDAAYRTARRHARDLGMRGSAALLVHRVYGFRTRLAYRWLKP